jgi:cytochrome c peroxidase
MPILNTRHFTFVPTIAIVLVAACGGSGPEGGSETVDRSSTAVTANDRLAACSKDPRVVTGLVSAQICAGADIFFRETFNGNGRTCGSCHPVAHNFTIDAPFVATLPASDPLFVFERDPNLTHLETPDLRNFGGVLENVDGFEDPTNKFVVRGVPHVLSMTTSLAPDTGDGSTIPPNQRTGWSGDGAPGTGTLREFLTGAVFQHYTKTLARVPGVDFRTPTSQELDLTAKFQLSLGRVSDPDVSQMNLADADAEDGRRGYIDPARGRCNFCHFNGGANSQLTGNNRNFDTRTRLRQTFATIGTVDGRPLFDGGFGGQGLAHPNFDALDLGFLNSFGNGTFNTPPVIEAADTLPGFHTNNGGTPEAIVAFYISSEFQGSSAEQELIRQFGTPINFPQSDIGKIARFMRVLNAALNLDMAEQRLTAAQTLVNAFHDTRADIQRTLMQLAENELNDALRDLNDGVAVQPFYPVSQDRLALAKTEIDAGIQATSFSQRQSHISTAFSRVQNARDQFGANINFQLGQGNLMF